MPFQIDLFLGCLKEVPKLICFSSPLKTPTDVKVSVSWCGVKRPKRQIRNTAVYIKAL
jgi:hypothetical protein